ncbi:MAG: OmpW family outer membrane protein [Pseudomonadota bacterium]
MKLIWGGACAAVFIGTLGMTAPTPVEAKSRFSSLDNPWYIRARLIGVIPDEDGSSGDIGSGEPDIDDAYVPEVDITYFFTKNIAAELILATAKHDVKWKNPDVDLGSVWLLPPTLTLQYHFTPDRQVRPYVGAGVNYTFFYNVDDGDAANVDYDNNIGFALQAGVDYEFRPNWTVNVDVKKLWLNTDVEVDLGATTADADVDIDPLIVGVGIGYKF